MTQLYLYGKANFTCVQGQQSYWTRLLLVAKDPLCYHSTSLSSYNMIIHTFHRHPFLKISENINSEANRLVVVNYLTCVKKKPNDFQKKTACSISEKNKLLRSFQNILNFHHNALYRCYWNTKFNAIPWRMDFYNLIHFLLCIFLHE